MLYKLIPLLIFLPTFLPKLKIWEVVKLRTFNDQDRVKSLCLKFESKRANEQNAVDIALQTILQNLAAPEGD